MAAPNTAYLHLAPVKPLTAQQQQWLAGRLSQYDLARLQKIRRAEVREQFLASRYWLYFWLQNTWNLGDFEIVRSAAGKPLILDSDLHFSLSHSHDWIAMALAQVPIGVDIELASRMQEKHLKWFSQAEQQAYASGLVSLVQLWTLKEAYVKQTGSKLARELAVNRIDWQCWQQQQEIFSQVWRHDWQLSAYAPTIGTWEIFPELSER